CVGTFLLEVAGQSMVLTASETNNTVGVCAGDEVSWVVTGLTGDYVAYLKNLVWEPLEPVSADGLAPAAESKLQIDDVRVDTNLVDLVWQVGAGNPADAVQRLFAGSAADALIEVVPASGVVTSGLNAVSEGIVDLAQAQGWVYWRVDTQVAADLGAGVAQGAVWRFAVVDLPVFTDGAPTEGAALDAFLQAGAAITAAADSSTPVVYSAVGLPPGLVIDPATGAISGVAKREGIYQVTVTATNSEGSTDLAFTISTQALPAYASNSTLEGALFSAEVAQKSVVARAVTGSLSFKAGRTGKITAKMVVAGKKHSLRGGWATGDTDGVFSAKLASRSGEELDVTLAQD
ncbi:MAG: Ig domain-containing protein, partial [Kiritimatiellae bacterium]|nr:Ig domain-containing protein [Kiritimatiellia bacterium]